MYIYNTAICLHKAHEMPPSRLDYFDSWEPMFVNIYTLAYMPRIYMRTWRCMHTCQLLLSRPF